MKNRKLINIVLTALLYAGPPVLMACYVATEGERCAPESEPAVYENDCVSLTYSPDVDTTCDTADEGSQNCLDYRVTVTVAKVAYHVEKPSCDLDSEPRWKDEKPWDGTCTRAYLSGDCTPNG